MSRTGLTNRNRAIARQNDERIFQALSRLTTGSSFASRKDRWFHTDEIRLEYRRIYFSSLTNRTIIKHLKARCEVDEVERRHVTQQAVGRQGYYWRIEEKTDEQSNLQG